MDFTHFECHKSVNSGKALGGHLSSPHVMVKRELNLEKLKKKLKLPKKKFFLWFVGNFCLGTCVPTNGGAKKWSM